MAHATSELTWLQHFLQEINLPTSTPISMYCDNQVALHICPIQSFMKELNTLKLIVTLLETR